MATLIVIVVLGWAADAYAVRWLARRAPWVADKALKPHLTRLVPWSTAIAIEAVARHEWGT